MMVITLLATAFPNWADGDLKYCDHDDAYNDDGENSWYVFVIYISQPSFFPSGV